MLRSNTQRFAYGGVTDMAGRFVIQNVEPGAYTANASADGYQQDQTRRGLLKAISVAEEQHVTDVSLKLIPLAVVNGKVLDEEGEPIAGANVIALRYFYFNGRKQLNTPYFGNTNDLGEFQLLDLQPGRYYFQVTRNTGQMFAQQPAHSSGPEETYPPTFYPNALDIGQATSTELDAGAQLNNVDFRLRKVRSYRVRGKVVDANGQPARNLNVQITPRTIPNGFARIGGMVQQDGSFEIRGVLSGDYDVMCQRQESGQPMAARQTIQVGGENVEGVVLALAPGFDVNGAIQTEGTPAPTSDGRPPASPQQPLRGQIALQQVDRPGSSPRATPAPDGTFVFHNVMPGRYQLLVTPNAGVYLKTIRMNDRDVPGGELDLNQATGASLTLVFGTDGAQISGTVQNKNGEAVQGLLITIHPKDELDSRRDLFKQTVTDQSGNFRISDLAPGTYKVFAWESADSMTAQVPEVRKAFESSAATVTPGANGRETVQLKAISADDFEREKSKLP